MRPQTWIAIGAFSAALSVAAGAFGAHALKESLTPEELGVWETAVLYHALHALALVACGLFAGRYTGARLPAWSFLVGSVFFSGSLYGLALGGPKFLGPITPLGGLAFMFGWVTLGIAALRARR